MPVVLELDFRGATVSVYFKDPQVRLRAGGREAVFTIEPLQVSRNRGFTIRELRQLQQALGERIVHELRQLQQGVTSS